MDQYMEDFARKRMEEGAAYFTVVQELVNMGISESEAREIVDYYDQKPAGKQFQESLPMPLWVYGVMAALVLIPIPVLAIAAPHILGIGLFMLGLLACACARIWIMIVAFTAHMAWGMVVLCLGNLFMLIFVVVYSMMGGFGRVWFPTALYFGGVVLMVVGAMIDPDGVQQFLMEIYGRQAR